MKKNSYKIHRNSKTQNRPWVQGNYSGLLVQLSSVYSALRGDASGVKNEDSSQGFVRSTTKYWVRVFKTFLFSTKKKVRTNEETQDRLS